MGFFNNNIVIEKNLEKHWCNIKFQFVFIEK